MPQPARALAGAACALVLSTTMFTPAAFADDAEGDDATTSRNAISAAADSIRGELGRTFNIRPGEKDPRSPRNDRYRHCPCSGPARYNV